MPKASFERCENPPDVARGQTVRHAGVLIDIDIVVEVDEAVAKAGEERPEDDCKQQDANRRGFPLRSRRNGALTREPKALLPRLGRSFDSSRWAASERVPFELCAAIYRVGNYRTRLTLAVYKAFPRDTS